MRAKGGSTALPDRAFRLARQVTSEPATAVLLLGPDARQVLAARAHVLNARIFAVEGGVLLVSATEIREWIPGALRLRAEGERLFLPVDAELVPSVVPEEANELTREHGAVLLPERTLRYRVDAALSVAALVHAGPVSRRDWRSLPERPAQASRLAGIRVELPPEAPEAVLESGAPPPAAPEDAGKDAGAVQKASFALGKALFGAGEALNMDSLKKAGAKWIDGLLSKAPSLGEGILGRQEAALRELLEKLRSGDVEDALRRALPLPEPGQGRGSTAARDAQLPVHDLAYSLRNVLGGGGPKGPASVWFGGFDVQRELAAEYRKAAEKAARDGDHRRAAFIYGKLLRDYRQAAHVLAQAGLHRDAAILYLTKCNDKLAAARSFAAAGEVDRAVELFRESGEHILAGDLLRSSGDEEGAVREFQEAAEALTHREEWLAASDLLATRALRPDLAIECLEKGWERRTTRPTFVCGVRLLDLYAREGRVERLLPLVSEAESVLAHPGREAEATSFWSAVTRLPHAQKLAPELADELRDHAKLGVALKLSQRAAWDTRPARVVTEILGVQGAWAPGVVQDARAAVDGVMKKRRVAAREVPSRVKVGQGIVTAACCAHGAGVVFLGMANGEVHRWKAEDRSVQRLSLHHPVVTALGCDATGRLLVAARGEAPLCELVSYSRRGEDLYFQISTLDIEATGEIVLSNVSDGTRDPRLCVWNGETLKLLDCPQLRPLRTIQMGEGDPPRALVMPPDLGAGVVPEGALVFAGERVTHKPWDVFLGWTPDIPWGVSLRAPPLSILEIDDENIEAVGLSEAGVISWGGIPRDGWSTRAGVAHRAAGYLAVTLIGPGRLAGVTSSAVEWLDVSSGDIDRSLTTPLEVKNAVACFHLDTTRELAIVTADGQIVCIRVPGN